MTFLVAMALALVPGTLTARGGEIGPLRSRVGIVSTTFASPLALSTTERWPCSSPVADCEGFSPWDFPDEDDGWQGGTAAEPSPGSGTVPFASEPARLAVLKPLAGPTSLFLLQRRLRC